MPWCDCHLVLPSLPPKTVLDSSAPHSSASTGANAVLAVLEEGDPRLSIQSSLSALLC